MSALGICSSYRTYLPTADELERLGLQAGWLRLLVYDVDEVAQATGSLDWRTGLILTANNETRQVQGDWSGWADTMQMIAANFADQPVIVCCGNELDLWNDTPPSFAARLANRAAAILRPAGIKVAATSVTSGRWQEYLAEMAALLDPEVDFCDFHAYGKGFADVPQQPFFGTIEDAIRHAAGLAGRPVIMSEGGVKLRDVGGEAGQAEYVRRWVETVRALPADVCPVACYFCIHDSVGAPSEQGESAFGLIRADGSKRPAYQAFRLAATIDSDAHSGDSDGANQQGVPTVPTTKYRVGEGVLARMAERSDSPASDETYFPIGAPKSQYSETFGKSGTRYVYLFDGNKTLTFLPDQAA